MMSAVIDRLFIKSPRFRRFVTRAVYGDKDTAVRLFGSDIAVNSLRENGYLRASRKVRGSSFLEHEVSVMLTLALLCDRADIFVDAGANIGLFSIFLSRRTQFNPHFAVMAFEPHPDTFERLNRNLTPLGAQAHNIALSDFEGELNFVDGAVSHVFTTIEKANYYNLKSEVFKVPARRLDCFDLHGKRIMLKIDVEGQELQILQGAKNLFESNTVRVVYIDGYDDEGVRIFLQSYGFKLFDHDEMCWSVKPHYSLLAVKE